jgi:2-oxoacid:acceptor oxidoreductase, beta subunit, pyruvate/2-ketoisovalerate family
MTKTRFDCSPDTDIAWCPGCGNYPLLGILKEALEELDIDPTKLVISSGIGQAAKMPQYVHCNMFNGLHGRAVPVATAIKAVNPSLTVIAEGGDGDMYGEGGNHFIHVIRRNPDITHLVHDNMVYGLTQGQASPTSPKGMKTPVQTGGVIAEPFNPLAAAIAIGAPFVARGFTGEPELTKNLIKEAVRYRGYALVDILDPCVSFNKTNTFKWYKEHTSILPDSWDPENRMRALEKTFETDPLPLGIFYRRTDIKPVFEEQLSVYASDTSPLWAHTRSPELISGLLK